MDLKVVDMTHKNRKIQSVSMSDAENGVIVNWDEKIEKPGKGMYDNSSYEYKKEVFSDEDLDKAFARFKELFMEARKD